MTVRKENRIIRIILQTLALLLFLVVLPFGSWYYLKNGLDYRVATMSDLKQYGKMPAVSYATFADTTFNNTHIKDKIVIANVLDLQNEFMRQTFGPILQKLHDQFKGREDIVFLVHIIDSTATQLAVNDFATQFELNKTKQFAFVKTASDSVSVIEQRYHLPHDTMLPYFVMSDTKGEIRRYYDVRNKEEVKRLVAHTALLLPLEKTREITLQREMEK